MIIYLQMIESDEDKSKFEQLYIMYKGLMFHVAMKILKNEFDAEDAVHQAFLSLIKMKKPNNYEETQVQGEFDRQIARKTRDNM